MTHMRKRRHKGLALIEALREARDCVRGMAATEFALLSPVLVLLFFGVLEAADAMTINRRVALSANTLADLVAQSEEVTPTDLNSLIIGVLEILEPNDTDSMTVNIVSVIADGDGDPIVHWSRDKDGGEPYSAGAAYPNLTDPSILTTSSSLIVVELTYPYTPQLTYRVIGSPINFNRKTIRWPRLAERVQLCVSPGNCTT